MKTLYTKMKVMQNFQIYFFQMQLNLEIPEFSDINLLAERSSHPIFKPSLKYGSYPSILAIKGLNPKFQFLKI